MKIRNGFVSNSSSSSFLVAFNSEPNSVEEAHENMFSSYNMFSKETSLKMAEIVFDQIKDQEPNDKETIDDFFLSMYDTSIPVDRSKRPSFTDKLKLSNKISKLKKNTGKIKQKINSLTLYNLEMKRDCTMR